MGVLNAAPREPVPQPPPATARELERPALAAFALETPIPVRSVRTLAVDSFNVALREARAAGQPWTKDPLQIGLRFAGHPLSGSRRTVQVQLPVGEWEDDRGIPWARVTVEASGWIDDSVNGERYVLWLVPDASGYFTVRRALWAWLCQRMRPEKSFYSADPCP